MASKPRAMVLVYRHELTHSVWVDLISQHRTEAGLEKHLRKGVKDGDWLGWRIIYVSKQGVGNV